MWARAAVGDLLTEEEPLLVISSTELERSDSFSLFIAQEERVAVSDMAAAAEQLMSARQRTFTRWLNQRLAGAKLQVVELERELSSGVVLLRLLQTFSPNNKSLTK